MAETTSTTTLSWRVHLAKEQPQRAVVATGVILLMVILIGTISQNLFGPLFAAILLFGSLHDFFLPIRYELNERGVEAKGLFSHTALEWNRAKRCYVTRDGVKVSPLSGPSRLESYRGVFLRCTGETRERVLALVQESIAPEPAASQPANHPSPPGEVA